MSKLLTMPAGGLAFELSDAELEAWMQGNLTVAVPKATILGWLNYKYINIMLLSTSASTPTELDRRIHMRCFRDPDGGGAGIPAYSILARFGAGASTTNNYLESSLSDHVGFVVQTRATDGGRYEFGLVDAATKQILPQMFSGPVFNSDIVAPDASWPVVEGGGVLRIGGVYATAGDSGLGGTFTGSLDAVIVGNVHDQDGRLGAVAPVQGDSNGAFKYFHGDALIGETELPDQYGGPSLVGTGLALTDGGIFDGWTEGPTAVALSQPTLDFALQIGALPPAAASVTVLNSGGGSLGAITLGTLTGAAAAYLTPSIVGNVVTLRPNGVPGSTTPRTYSLPIHTVNGGTTTLTGTCTPAALPDGPRPSPLYVSLKVFDVDDVAQLVQLGTAVPASSTPAVATFAAHGTFADVGVITTVGAGETTLSRTHAGEVDDEVLAVAAA
jgi:hypothetical protein